MRIATKLRVAAITPAVMAVAFIVGLGITNAQISRLHAEEAKAVEISVGLNDLNDLAQSYVDTHEERPKIQFGAQLEQVTALVDEARSQDTEYRGLLDRIATDTALVGSLFDRLVDGYERGATPGDPLAAEAEQRLAGQLFVRSRRANAAAVRLATNLGADIAQTQERIVAAGTAWSALMALLLAVGLIALLTSITRSIGELMDGTEIVGSGELDHRIALHTRDELNDLARSFNRMAGRLQKVTVSSKVLGVEVERRTEMARELDTQRTQLETILANMEEAVGVWSPEGEHIRMNEAMVRMHGFTSEAQMRRHLSGFSDITLRTLDGLVLPLDEWPPAKVIQGESFSNWVLEVSVAATGVTFVGSYSGAPVRDAEGALLFGVVTVHDITELHAARMRERQELATTQVLLEVAGALSTWTDLDLLTRNLASLVLKASDHERVTIGLLEDGGRSVRVAASAGEHAIPAGTTFQVADVVADVRDMLATGHTTLVDYDAEEEGNGQGAERFGSRLALQAPLVFGTETLGYIAADDPDGRQPFTRREVDIIEAIASQAAVAVVNARRYAAERDIAERLQTALLELPATVPGVEFAHLYRSASLSARVGGDFYDLFEIGDRRVGITIGDVAGKGLDAAALTSLVKNAIRAHANEVGNKPGRVLELTNDVIYRSTSNESFVTVFFGVLNRRDGSIVYSSAGHPAAIIASPDGTATRAVATGPILGAFSGVHYSPGAPGRLGTGDLLFAYTDGLTEARRGDEFFGEDRVVASVARMAGESPQEVVDSIVAEAMEFTGGRLMDDVAILALRRVGARLAGRR